MGFTVSSKLALPLPDDLESISNDNVNANFTTVGDACGSTVLNGGAIATYPAVSKYDGKILKEKTTGKMVVTEKQAGGGFLDKIVRWPWHIVGSKSISSLNGNYYNADLAFSSGINTSAADINGSGEIILPVNGIYILSTRALHYNTANSTGVRQQGIVINSTVIEEEEIVIDNPGYQSSVALCFQRYCTAGSVITSRHRQTSATTYTVLARCTATLVHATD